MCQTPNLWLPFLHPCLKGSPSRALGLLLPIRRKVANCTVVRSFASASALVSEAVHNTGDLHIEHQSNRLNPPSSDFSRNLFADRCTVTLHAGSGGHGCVSFLREKFVAEGPPNGGDGGSGGSIYIQAVPNEHSLHKILRQRIVRAGRGKNGQGKNKGGQRGEDALLQVPVGTVVREIARHDPVIEDMERRRAAIKEGRGEDEARGDHKWLFSPSNTPGQTFGDEGPPSIRAKRTALASMQPPQPIFLDLSKPMETPMLLAAGAIGGLGNPHFVSKTMGRPKFASRGMSGMQLQLEFELKLLADVGFVGMPNAGKSTLLRALTNSRARVGAWAFTTLQPNIGTVVLDNNAGRIRRRPVGSDGQRRTNFTIADIPGLISDAHLDKGLGLGFLRHVERARVLAFVVDLSSGDPVQSLRALWRELDEFERIRERELNEKSETRIVDWRTFGSTVSSADSDDKVLAKTSEPQMHGILGAQLKVLADLPPISTKPWFVVATKADLPGTEGQFTRLQEYLKEVEAGDLGIMSSKDAKNRWRGSLAAIPVSAVQAEGVEQIPEWILSLLDEHKG